MRMGDDLLSWRPTRTHVDQFSVEVGSEGLHLNWTGPGGLEYGDGQLDSQKTAVFWRGYLHGYIWD
jgi:hypothetical protein